MRKHSSTELGSHRNWYAASESNTSCLGVDQMHTASLLAAYKKLVSRPGFGPGPDGLRGHYAAVTPATHRKFGGARRIRTFSRRFKRPLCCPLTLARHIGCSIPRLLSRTFIHLSREPDRSYLSYPVLFRVAARVEFPVLNKIRWPYPSCYHARIFHDSVARAGRKFFGFLRERLSYQIWTQRWDARPLQFLLQRNASCLRHRPG